MVFTLPVSFTVVPKALSVTSCHCLSFQRRLLYWHILTQQPELQYDWQFTGAIDATFQTVQSLCKRGGGGSLRSTSLVLCPWAVCAAAIWISKRKPIKCFCFSVWNHFLEDLVVGFMQWWEVTNYTLSLFVTFFMYL